MHASQIFILLGIVLYSLFGVVTSYSLAATYDASNFFDEFSFFTGADPTYGFVSYASQGVAENSKLVGYTNGQVYLGVDSSTYNPAGGRASVRLSSNTAFGEGLFIADIQHMPVGCGTWPAFWMFGPNWPHSGEIDIIEGVNDQSTDSITLHTSPGCVVSNANSQPGTFTVTSDCSTSNSNVGCSVGTGNPNNFGTGFNAVGGGTYAMQWAGSGIYVWFWERGTVPGDVTTNPPNVAAWGQPLATFTGDGCDFNTYFSEQNLIFDTTFCGAWAGAVWGQGQCAGLADTCSDYVANNPAAFTDAYWLINSVQVYQLQPSGSPQDTYNQPPPAPPPPPAPAPTPAPVQTQPSGSTYTIQAGDTFWSISIQFGTTVAALEAANPSLNPNDLQIGEVISIP